MKKCKLILTILCCLVGLGCFSCKADNYIGNFSRTAIAITSTAKCLTAYINTDFCIYQNYSNTAVRISTGNANDDCSDIETPINSVGIAMLQNNLYCFKSGTQLKVRTNNATNLFIYDMGNSFSGTGNCPTCPTIDSNYCTENNLCPSCPTCPDQYTSLECQSEYSLIPISSVDQSYCVNNNLCPSGGGGECESGSVNWSSIYVNNIQHIGKPNIFITIPEEIDWDYTNNTGSFDLDIIGYNVDYEKMSDILEVQNYKPSSEDFTNLVGLLAPYMSILVFCLFAYIIIKRLKKPFSSKLK